MHPLSGFQSASLFAAGVGLTALTAVLDFGMVGLLRGHLQLRRNVALGVAKLGMVLAAGLWLPDKTGMSIFGAWVGGILVSLLSLAGLVIPGGIPRHHLVPAWRFMLKMGRRALAHYPTNVALLITPLAMPLLATQLLTARNGGFFYIAWIITAAAQYPTVALALTLYAVGSAQPETLPGKARLTLQLSFLAAVLANAVLLIGAGPILNVFGRAYSDHAASALRVLALGLFPLIVKDHFIAISRVHRRLKRTALTAIPASAMELGLAGLGASLHGITGLAVGWLAALCAEGLFMGFTVFRTATAADVPVESGSGSQA
jgi:O-antigen/teichoic acid export membrane protein